MQAPLEPGLLVWTVRAPGLLVTLQGTEPSLGRASVPTSITLKEISSECSEAKTSRCIPRVRPLGNLSLIWLAYLVWYPWAACPVHMGVATDYMVPGIKNLKSPTRYGSCSQPTKMFVITSWAASV